VGKYLANIDQNMEFQVFPVRFLGDIPKLAENFVEVWLRM